MSSPAKTITKKNKMAGDDTPENKFQKVPTAKTITKKNKMAGKTTPEKNFKGPTCQNYY